jgi:hypothetical protein
MLATTARKKLARSSRPPANLDPECPIGAFNLGFNNKPYPGGSQLERWRMGVFTAWQRACQGSTKPPRPESLKGWQSPTELAKQSRAEQPYHYRGWRD